MWQQQNKGKPRQQSPYRAQDTENKTKNNKEE